MPVLEPSGPTPHPPVAPSPGICSSWATSADVAGSCADYEFDPALLDDGLQVASEVLYELTGRRWPGECEESVRPCGARKDRQAWYPPPAHYQNGYPHQICGCDTGRECGCRRLSEIRLPGYPVTGITEVTIDGVVVDPALYRVDDWRYLVYLDADGESGRAGWPCCQDIRRGVAEADTFGVIYTFGVGPPLGGVKAAAALGCQLALSQVPGAPCALPQRVTTITRSGVTLALLDPLTLFADGRTGIASVDLWLESIRLGRARRPSTVVIPGMGRTVRRAGTS